MWADRTATVAREAELRRQLRDSLHLPRWQAEPAAHYRPPAIERPGAVRLHGPRRAIRCPGRARCFVVSYRL
ncbi:hypothetical protein SBA5_70166 [Candidatus Sulfotelmatomonas gaucii]|uniref:Uncharacterized protein n=1 Tax=Candidatus Sulfuritelmatomonas gaucii TaxID=2043161 RepID=A0A2N9M0U2_9BACT|nr:hypothetical protein SBA5_70166 [Candidatus Sulfotelmatomonas gaucii]